MEKGSPIKKAVFPVAGLGTRFLPATKSMPKEMLPLVDKPLIHYAVEEAKAAGIEEFIFITGKGKTAIEDYFDSHYELEDILKKSGKENLLSDFTKTLPRPDQIVYVRQHEALGLGHAIWCARKLVGDDPFAVLLADDQFLCDMPCLSQMVSAYIQYPGNIISVEEVAPEETQKYGVIDIAEQVTDQVLKIKGMVEKPIPSEAPSNFAVTGRYILQPGIFDYLDKGVRGAGDEIQLTDAIADQIGKRDVFGFKYDGIRYDCGTKTGFLEANIAYALARSEMRQETIEILSHFEQTLKSEAA